jgi:hypothetical protein
MSVTFPINRYIYSVHALYEMTRRGLNEKDVAQVILKPEQTDLLRPGRVVFQSRIKIGDPQKIYLLRVIVDIDRDPVEIVTVYKTSKVEKYWRE